MKKTIILAVLASILFGGIAGATSTYYLNEINNHKEAKKASITTDYYERNDEIEQQLYHDTVMILNREYDRMDAEADAYLNEKFQQKANNALNSNDIAITAETDRAIVEIKAHIDALFAGK